MSAVAAGYLLFFAMGVIQLWLIYQSLATWLGSALLAAALAFISAYFPLPWFIPAYWYLEGTPPLAYIGSWAIAWGVVLIGSRATPE